MSNATSQSDSEAATPSGCESCGKPKRGPNERTCGRDECLARAYGTDVLDGLDTDLRRRALIALEGK